MINHYVGETCYYYPSNIDFKDRYDYSYAWFFDDNITSNAYKPSHIWQKPGKHTITLIVTNINNNMQSTYSVVQTIGLNKLKPIPSIPSIPLPGVRGAFFYLRA